MELNVRIYDHEEDINSPAKKRPASIMSMFWAPVWMAPPRLNTHLVPREESKNEAYI
jgi:hypothetical protein